MNDECLQLAQESMGQFFDGLSTMNVFAERPVHSELFACNQSRDFQEVTAAALRVTLGAGVLRRYLERRGRRQHVIELAKIVKAHFSHWQSTQRTRDCGIIAQVAEESITKATTGN